MNPTRMLALCAVAVLLNAGVASADTVVGQTAPPTTSCAAGTLYQAGTAGPPAYTTPSGVITKWTVRTDANVAPIKLKVLHALGGGSYRVVGESAAVTPNPNSTQTFSTRIPVGTGDYLGISVLSGSADCRFATGAYGDAVRETSTGDPAVGSTITFPTGHPNSRLDVSAVVEPDKDGDGFGDTSEDRCPTDPTTQGQCEVDLSIQAVSIFKSPRVGRTITWSITVRNHSRNTSTDHEIVWSVPRWALVDSVTLVGHAHADCGVGAVKPRSVPQDASCFITVPPHGAVNMLVRSRAFAPGMMTGRGAITDPLNTATPDPDPSNDQTSARRFIYGTAPPCALRTSAPPGDGFGTRAGDIIHGTRHGDKIFGYAAGDCLFGGSGNDRIHGGSGNDRIHGGPGDDEIWSGSGHDRINGGSGNDVIHAHDGQRDVIKCGSGVDKVYADPQDVVSSDCEVVVR